MCRVDGLQENSPVCAIASYIYEGTSHVCRKHYLGDIDTVLGLARIKILLHKPRVLVEYDPGGECQIALATSDESDCRPGSLF